MKRMFINISNHPSEQWTDEQKAACDKYVPGGAAESPVEIIDIPFPAIGIGTEDSAMESSFLMDKIFRMIPYEDGKRAAHVSAMVMGEMVAVFYLVGSLQSVGINCFASITRRESVEEKQADGSMIKRAVFRFIGYRQYPTIKLITPMDDGD